MDRKRSGAIVLAVILAWSLAGCTIPARQQSKDYLAKIDPLFKQAEANLETGRKVLDGGLFVKVEPARRRELAAEQTAERLGEAITAFKDARSGLESVPAGAAVKTLAVRLRDYLDEGDDYLTRLRDCVEYFEAAAEIRIQVDKTLDRAKSASQEHFTPVAKESLVIIKAEKAKYEKLEPPTALNAYHEHTAAFLSDAEKLLKDMIEAAEFTHGVRFDLLMTELNKAIEDASAQEKKDLEVVRTDDLGGQRATTIDLKKAVLEETAKVKRDQGL